MTSSLSSTTIERELTFSRTALERLRLAVADEGSSFEVAVLATALALLARYGTLAEVAVVVETERGARFVGVRTDDAPRPPELRSRAARALADAPAFAGGETGHVLPSLGEDAVVRVVLGGASTEPDADLAIVTERGAVRLRFRMTRFTLDSANRLGEHFRRLFEGLAAHDGPVSGIGFVGPAERARVLHASNLANVSLEEALPSIVEVFEAHARRAPDAEAVVDGDRTLTYRELDRAADGLAAHLRRLGAVPGSRVAVHLDRGAAAIIGFVGILKARCAYVPIDTSYPAGRVAAILEGAEPDVVLDAETFPAGAPSAEPSGDSVQPDDVAYTIFTSGSTGQPKGVVVDHRALASYIRAVRDAYAFESSDRVLQGASLGFDLSLEEIVVTLAAGATLVLRSAAPIESVQAFVEECTRGRLTILSITSALWHELTMRLEDGSVSLPPRLRLVILGADAARPDVLAVWQRVTGSRIRLVNSYGLTETTIVATVWEAGAARLDGSWRALPVGRPLRNATAYVLDQHDALAPIGVPGQICIGGLAVAARYLGDPALTEARFVRDPFLAGGRMYRTGDRGVLRHDGVLEFLGRADYQVKVGGVRIELGEIEARLRELPGVVEGIVVARKSGAGETTLEAFVTTSSTEVAASQLREHLERTVPRAAVPSRIHVLDCFPLTAAGKIDRRALVAPQGRPKADRRPEGALEELVASVVAEVLGLPEIAMEDRFGDLGGTSLAAVRAASILGARLGRRVRAPVFLDAATLREACRCFDREPAHDGVVQALARDAAAPLSLGPQRGDPEARLETVLLTGATGYYGTFVLAELLRETSAHVVCLVRAGSVEAGRQRLARALAARECEVDADVLASRVSVALGDLAAPDLGLDADTYVRLAASADTVFHLGAQVNVMLPYAALRAANVLAVDAVLRFATTGRAKTVHHVSTVEVLADTERSDPRALSERRAAVSPSRLHDGYGQSKWVAEKRIEAARACGVSAYIHRPGRLMGHSESGVLHADDFLVRMLEACGEIGALPALDGTVDVTPVDYASRALVRLAAAPPRPEAAPAYHFVGPRTLAWSEFAERVVALGYPLQVVPHDHWRAMLESRAASSPADFLLYLAAMAREETEASIHGGHHDDLTRAALGGAVTCPAVEERLIGTYLRRLEFGARFPAPAALASAP